MFIGNYKKSIHITLIVFTVSIFMIFMLFKVIDNDNLIIINKKREIIESPEYEIIVHKIHNQFENFDIPGTVELRLIRLSDNKDITEDAIWSSQNE